MGGLALALQETNSDMANICDETIDSIEVMAAMLGYTYFKDAGGPDRVYFLKDLQVQLQLNIGYDTIEIHGFQGNPKVQQIRDRLEVGLPWALALVLVEKLL